VTSFARPSAMRPRPLLDDRNLLLKASDSQPPSRFIACAGRLADGRAKLVRVHHRDLGHVLDSEL